MKAEWWLDADISTWPKFTAMMHQKCGQCQQDVHGQLCTPARGVTEHVTCAATALREIRGDFTEHQGTQAALLAAVRANAIPGVSYDHYEHGRGARYAWRERKI